MKAVLQRGQGPLSAAADEVLFHFGQPPSMPLAGPCFSLAWDEAEPAAVFAHANHSQSIPLQRIHSSLYSFSHHDFGLIVLAKSLWSDAVPIPIGPKGLLLSYQGWSDGQWFDGANGRWMDTHYVDLVLPGAPFRLELSERIESPALDWLSWQESERCFAWKQSLVCALRMQKNPQPGTLLIDAKDNYRSVLNALLLRLAFPNTPFELLAPSDGWRRLAQNLALTPVREEAAGKRKKPHLSLELGWGAGTEDAIEALLRWQMSRSPFIPGKLWARLSR